MKNSPVRARGRTLIELLITIVIGLVVLGAMFVVYMSTYSGGRQSTAVSRMNEDAAVALNHMAGSLRMAGYSYPRVNVTPAKALVGGLKVGTVESNFVGAGVRGCDNGFVSTTVAFAALECATSAGASSFAVRFEGDSNSTLPTSGGTTVTDCTYATVPATAVSAYDGTTLYALVESRFFVGTVGSSGTSELSCAGNGKQSAAAAPFRSEPLVQFVEDMVIRYGIAADSDSRAVERYATASEVDALGGDVDRRWGRVVSMKVCIVMRSAEPDPSGGGKYIACDGSAVASSGNLIRRSYSTVFTLRNRGGFAAGA